MGKTGNPAAGHGGATRDGRSAAATPARRYHWRRMAGLLTTVALGFGPGALTGAEPQPVAPGNGPAQRATVTIAGELFHLEVAADDVHRVRGLMHRTAMPPDEGMLFVFPDARVLSFWMMNTRIDLDILFLDDNGRIVAMRRMPAEPPQAPGEPDAAYAARLPRHSSGVPARFAIELNAGTVAALGCRVGDRVEFDATRLAALAE